MELDFEARFEGIRVLNRAAESGFMFAFTSKRLSARERFNRMDECLAQMEQCIELLRDMMHDR